MEEKPGRGGLKTVEHKIFLAAVIIIVLISIPVALYESESLEIINNIFDQSVAQFVWGYIWYANILLAAGHYLSFSKYGRVVLGAPDEKPKFTLFEYASLL